MIVNISRSRPVKARLAARLVQEVRTLADFRGRWIDPPSRRELIDALITSGCSPAVVRMVDEKEAFDLYDVLAELGWGMNPRTRRDRTLAFTYKNEDWLNSLSQRAAKTIRTIAGQFDRSGTEGLENPQIFQTPDVKLPEAWRPSRERETRTTCSLRPRQGCSPHEKNDPEKQWEGNSEAGRLH